MKTYGYLLGLDCGTSSIKATLLDAQSGKTLASASSPKKEMAILAPRPGWAEQDPVLWWKNVQHAVAELKEKSGADLRDVAAVGISYQMHGLVLVDKNRRVLRPAIIWCDSRAVPFGEKALAAIGKKQCLARLLNSPGNFTASKLAWVKLSEPTVFKRIHKIMLPGDYIALMLTGEIATTPSGLSEGVLWDFKNHGLAQLVLDAFNFDKTLIPEVIPTFSCGSRITQQAATLLGLKPGIPVSYRSGDQPNNALALNVLNPGEIAATAGTSGVVYGVTDAPLFETHSRVNTFVHVNYTKEKPRYGVLLCVNGTGICNSWLKHTLATTGRHGLSYEEMNALAGQAPVGSQGLCMIPFGNGVERTLNNKPINASLNGLDFNVHTKAHVLRAAQEGIVFALNYGLGIMRDMGVKVATVRAGHANMFLSPLFGQAFATVTNTTVELFSTDGSQGAARGAGIGAGLYKNFKDAYVGLKAVKTIKPDKREKAAYIQAYQRWLSILENNISKPAKPE